MNGDDEVKKLLRENVEISKESLKILKGFRRNNRISAFFRIIYWLIISQQFFDFGNCFA